MPDASCRVSNASDVIYSASPSWFSLTISASSKSARWEKSNRASNAGWNFFCLMTSASHIDEAKKTLTPTSSPACLSLPIAEDISGASALTDPDDLSVYTIRACGSTTPACPVPGVGLGGLTPLPCHTPDAVLGWLTPPPDSPVLGGLPLTLDDFRTHRAPMPPTHMTVRPRRSSATRPKAPFATYAISAPDDAPRPTRRTRSQTTVLDGNAPSSSDRVRRFCASSTPHVAASAIGPPRLHDFYRSPCLD